MKQLFDERSLNGSYKMMLKENFTAYLALLWLRCDF